MDISPERSSDRRISELKASYEGQSLLRIQEANKRRKSDEKYTRSRDEVLSITQKNLKATEAVATASFNLVRSHSALHATEQELKNTQANLKKARTDYKKKISNEQRQSEIDIISLKRSNLELSQAAEEAESKLSEAESNLKAEQAQVTNPRMESIFLSGYNIAFYVIDFRYRHTEKRSLSSRLKVSWQLFLNSPLQKLPDPCQVFVQWMHLS